MQQVKRQKLTVEMVIKNQKQFSKKIHNRTLKTVDEILESCDKYEIKDGKNETFLFNQVNHYYWDLANVAFNLQQILIDIGKNISTANNLENILDKLNMITFFIQESLKLEPKKMKNKLKDDIVIVGFLVEKLMKIIESDDSYEYKQRILDCQFDLVIHTTKLKYGIQYFSRSIAEIQKCTHDRTDDLKSTLMDLKTGHEIVEDDFSHYIRRCIQHLQYLVDYILQLRSSERFTASLNEILKNSEELAVAFINGILDALESGNPIQNFLANIEKCQDLITTGSVEMQKGVSDGVQKNLDKKGQKAIQEIILYLFICGLNIIESMINTVEDVITNN